MFILKSLLIKNHPFYDIKEMDNVCLTPHIAWASFEARTKVINEMAENTKAYYNNSIRNRIDLINKLK